MERWYEPEINYAMMSITKRWITWILAPLYLITPGTVVSVVNSYAATSEYTPAKLLSSVDLPTEGKPGAKIHNGSN